MQEIFEGRIYTNKQGGVVINFGTDMVDKLIGTELHHKEEIVAKWDGEKQMLIIKRKKDVVRFD